MRDNYFNKIIWEKLHNWEVPVDQADWGLMEQSLIDDFDAEMREELSDLAVPYVPEDWNAFAALLNTQFDAKVRESLENHSEEVIPTDWALMSSMLEEAPFDHSIAKTLGDFSVPVDPADWELVASQLDDHPLDTTVRTALNEFTVPYVDSDWDNLEEKIDGVLDSSIQEKLAAHAMPMAEGDWESMAANLDDHPFDTHVREKVAGHSLPYASSDWKMMSEKLNAPFDQLIEAKFAGFSIPFLAKDWKIMKDYLKREKATPVTPVNGWTNWRNYVAAASVIIALWLMWGSQKGFVQIKEIANSEITPSASSHSDLLKSDEAAPKNGIQEGSATLDLAPTNINNGQKKARNIDSPNNNDRNISEERIAYTDKENKSSGEQSIHLSFSEINDSLNNSPSTDIDSDSYTTMALQNKEQQADVLFATIYPVSNKIDSPLLDSSVKQDNTEVPLVDIFGKERTSQISLGLYGSNTSTRAELSDPQYKYGFTGGLRVEMHINDEVSVVSGLLYGEQHFEHEYFVITDSRLLTNIVKGDLKVVEAPLLLKYKFPSESKLSLYTQAGFMIMVTLEEKYVHHDRTSPDNQANPFVASRLLKPQSEFRGLNTYPGNIFTSIGLEYDLNNRLSFQIEPYFQRNLQRTKGSGSIDGEKKVEKKLSTTGIGFSLIYRLWNKTE